VQLIRVRNSDSNARKHVAIKFAKSFAAEVTLLSTSPGKEQDALDLGAHQFVVTTEEISVQKLAGYLAKKIRFGNASSRSVSGRECLILSVSHMDV
jgi:hypothetical protein